MAFDFRSRFQLSLLEVGESIRWGEAIALVDELRQEYGTRFHAAVNGWAFPATIADLIATRHAEWYMNVHRDRKVAPQPITLPTPWPDEEVFSPEEIARYENLLAQRSAFPADPD